MDDRQGSEGLDFSRRRFLLGAGAMTAGLMLRGTPRLGLGHLALSPRSQDQPAIDVTAAPFGARGDGVTNDRGPPFRPLSTPPFSASHCGFPARPRSIASSWTPPIAS